MRTLALGAVLSAMLMVTRTGPPVRTRVDSDEGMLDFQDYFVGRQCKPVVKSLHFAGAEAATPHPDFLTALQSPRLRAVIICPSNPFISRF